jgi:hypothetical protein
MASKRKKILQQLVNCIEHDFGFYNPIWKWSSLPDNIRDNFDLIENDLLIWKEKGFIDLYTEDDIRYIKIFNVPVLENPQH